MSESSTISKINLTIRRGDNDDNPSVTASYLNSDGGYIFPAQDATFREQVRLLARACKTSGNEVTRQYIQVYAPPKAKDTFSGTVSSDVTTPTTIA